MSSSRGSRRALRFGRTPGEKEAVHTSAGGSGRGEEDVSGSRVSLMSRSVPTPSVMHRKDWRQRYLNTLHIGSPAAAPVAAPVTVARRTVRVASTSVADGSSVASSSSLSSHVAGASEAGGGDSEEFMFIEDDIFGWGNDAVLSTKSARNRSSTTTTPPTASSSRSRHGGSRPRRRSLLGLGRYTAGDDRGRPALASPAPSVSTFVPPHQLVARDTMSLDVRRARRLARAPM